MTEKEIVIKYLDSVNKLEKYYSERNKELDEYVSIWRTLEKGDEIEQLRFVFNHEPGKMIKYIGVIDYLNEVLLTLAIKDKERKNIKDKKQNMFLKDYIKMFSKFKKDDYLSDEDLSSKTKRLAEIYFDFKNIEKSLYSWLKETQSKTGYQSHMTKGIYI